MAAVIDDLIAGVDRVEHLGLNEAPIFVARRLGHGFVAGDLCCAILSLRHGTPLYQVNGGVTGVKFFGNRSRTDNGVEIHG
ncbi:hypothetical protein KCP70_24285 [Salmonella enterica subsp. enterica]|nr:hypothetical protein KCP70_24285 [Salmonella enterica subsp. enterica]